jgi:Uma2 family endonuclease
MKNIMTNTKHIHIQISGDADTVDAGFGGIRHIGKPKQPTLTVCLLIDGEYETRMFRGNDAIVSVTFPALQLTAAQVLGL